MKKIFSILMVVCAMTAMGACGGSSDDGSNSGTTESSESKIETVNLATTVAEILTVDLNKLAAGSFGVNGEVIMGTPPRYKMTFFFKNKLDAAARTKWLDNLNSHFQSVAIDGKIYGSPDFSAVWNKTDEDLSFADGEGERFFAKLKDHQFSILITYGETNYPWTDGAQYPYFDLRIERLDK